MAELDVQVRLLEPCVAEVSFDEAIARLGYNIVPISEEEVALSEAHGRILSQSVVAAISCPAVDLAAMDGYAVATDNEASLRQKGEAYPGQHLTCRIAIDEVVRVRTGAPVPGGTSRVVPQELVEQRDGTVTVPALAGGRRHVRLRGCDFEAGDVLLNENERLTAQALLVSAAADAATVKVRRRVRLAIVATGDELRRVGDAAPTPLSIPDSVSHAIAALAKDWGAEIVGQFLVTDCPQEIQQSVRTLLGQVDVIVITGGASLGDRDFSQAALATLGMLTVFSKVAIKPGKPVWYGRCRSTHVIGLPGNPTAALVTGRLFLAPLICRLSGGQVSDALAWHPALLTAPQPGNASRETFLCGQASPNGIRPLTAITASSQTGLAKSNVLIRQQPNSPPVSEGGFTMVLDF